MKDLFASALPWLCFGAVIALLIVLCIVNYRAHKKAEKENREYDNYANEGMCIGLITTCLLFGTEYMLFGMLGGIAIGMCIPKHRKNNNENN